MSEGLQSDLKKCAQFLNKCHQLPDSHKALQENANASDLIQSLMDGVVLCKLLNFLSDGAIDPYSMNEFAPRTELSQFQCSKNIRLFLQLCKDYFHIDEKYLFDVADLYEAKNIRKVIKLLSILSSTPQAKNCGITNFSFQDDEMAPSHSYTNLEIEPVEPKSVDTDGDFDELNDHSDQKIYDTVVHKGKRYSNASEPRTAREYCIKEIVDTEKNYVDMLSMLSDKYMKPLSQILSKQEIGEIFMYIEDLSTIHRNILSDLQLSLQSPRFMSLHEVFIQANPKLLVYGQYCSHLQTAKSLVVDISKHDQEKKAKIELCQSNSNNYNKFHLTELLTVPMQRVLKYHLLLENLCKLTDDNHEDKPGLIQAYDSMKDLATCINEVKRDLDCITAIDQIQESISEIVLPPDTKLTIYGRRQIDGELKYAPNLDCKPKSRHVFVFDRVLLLCKTKGESFTFKEAFHVLDNKIERLDVSQKKADKWVYGFVVQAYGDQENIQILYFYTKSEESRNNFIRSIELTVDNVSPPGYRSNGYHFELYDFPRPTYCDICGKLLRGMFYQGYRCKNSKKAAHKACILRAPPLSTHQLPASYSPSLSTKPSIMNRPSVVPVRGSLGVGSSFMTSNSSVESLQNCSGLSSLDTSDGRLSSPWSSGRPESRVNPVTPLIVRSLHAYNGNPLPPPTNNFSQRHPLLFAANETIQVLNCEDSVWWLGRIHNREGLFPSTLTTEIKSSVPLSTSSFSNHPSTPTNHASPFHFYPHTQSTFSPGSSHYDDLTPYPWFVGEMDRVQATNSLQGHPNGTYLIRLSKERPGEYSLSVVYDSPKHIKIQRADERVFLSDNYSFPNIPALVQYYSVNSLHMCFNNLNTTLSLPYRSRVALLSPIQSVGSPQLNFSSPEVPFKVRVLYDFDATTDRQMHLRKGEIVTVIGLTAADRGWWKGSCNGRVGFFPLKYVSREL